MKALSPYRSSSFTVAVVIFASSLNPAESHYGRL